MIWSILFITVQFCTAQIREQSATDNPQLIDELPPSAENYQEMEVELSQLPVSQPQAIRTLLTDKDMESMSADPYHPVYTLMRRAEVPQNIANPEAHEHEIPSTLSQEPVGTDMDTESIDTGLATLLVDGIYIKPLSVGTDVEILLNDTSRVRNALITSDKHRVNTSDPRAHLQVSMASFGSIRKDRNVEEERNKSLDCTEFGASGSEQSIESIQNNSDQISRKPFQCDICLKQFRTSSDCRAHRRVHTGEKPFQCDICPKQFRTSSNFRKHRRIHTGEKPFKCDTCPKQFFTSSDYTKHQRIHTGEKPFQCDICPKQFRTSSYYQEHRRIHTGEKPFQCDICSKQFRTSSDCQKHRRIHTGEKPYQCNICPKQYRTSSDYQAHRRIHTGEKPVQCDICPKQFRTSSDCQKHRRIHTGEKPFLCNVCPKQFRTSSNYQEHRRIHTGEKPFQCDCCRKQFRVFSNYQRHQLIRTGEKPFQCDICSKRFRSSSNYQRHRRTHVEKSYICYWCNQDYCSKCSLIKHVKRCSSRNSSYTANPVVSSFISSDKRQWTYML